MSLQGFVGIKPATHIPSLRLTTNLKLFVAEYFVLLTSLMAASGSRSFHLQY
jgi:hypothetical protein